MIIENLMVLIVWADIGGLLEPAENLFSFFLLLYNICLEVGCNSNRFYFDVACIFLTLQLLIFTLCSLCLMFD